MTLLSQPSTAAPPRPAPLSRSLARVVALLLVLDAMVVLTSFLLAWSFRSRLDAWFPLQQAPYNTLDGQATPWVLLVWMGCLMLRGGYRRHNIGAGFDEFRQVATASVLALGLLATLAFFAESPMSRGFLVLCFLVGIPLLLSERYAVRKVIHALRRRGRLRGRVLAVCDRRSLAELDNTLRRLEHLGLSIVGTCIPGGRAERDLALPVPCYGGVDDVLSACEETGADTVIVAGEGSPTSEALRRIGWALEGTEIELVVVPSLIDVAGPRIHMRHLSGLPLVHIEEPRAGLAGGLVKRMFDVVIAGLMLMIAAPVMLLIAVAIKLDDGGPVFFRQVRSGRHGEHFVMTKFRSMVADAENRIDEVLEFNDVDDVLFKMKNDPRVTRVGKLLRRLSIDELPQLVDIIRGDMSMVGPRPPLPSEVEQYPAEMRRRLLVRPGLTGLWQVSGRSDLSFDEAVRMDLYYVDNWSIMADVIIMLKTVRAVVMSRGAY